MNSIVDDDYDHDNEELEYTPENIMGVNVRTSSDDNEFNELQDQFNSLLLNSCECSGEEDDCSTCSHGGNYIINDFKTKPQLVLKSWAKDLLYECSPICKCNPQRCLNRLVQKGPCKGLQIVNSEKYGSKGLITTIDIPEGTFICEYAGELITRSESLARSAANENAGKMNYILYLREYNLEKGNGESCYTTIIDPSRRGNIGRYLNHSCSPNCKIISVRIDCPIPKVAIFAKQHIPAGEELCFHYSDGAAVPNLQPSSKITTPCVCRSENCTGYLPNIDFQNN